MKLFEDRDAFNTLFLTVLVIVLSGGIAFWVTLVRVIRIARKSNLLAPDSYPCLVFGKRLFQGEPDSEYRKRLDRAYVLIGKNANRLVLLLGGKTSTENISEARAGLEYLKSNGLGTYSTIILEEASTNTLENLKNARKLLSSRNQDAIILLSSAYHLARCSQLATSLKLKHVLCASERIHKRDYLRCFPEAFFLLWFNTGRGWALLTKNKRQIERIT